MSLFSLSLSLLLCPSFVHQKKERWITNRCEIYIVNDLLNSSLGARQVLRMHRGGLSWALHAHIVRLAMDISRRAHIHCARITLSCHCVTHMCRWAPRERSSEYLDMVALDQSQTRLDMACGPGQSRPHFSTSPAMPSPPVRGGKRDRPGGGGGGGGAGRGGGRNRNRNRNRPGAGGASGGGGGVAGGGMVQGSPGAGRRRSSGGGAGGRSAPLLPTPPAAPGAAAAPVFARGVQRSPSSSAAPPSPSPALARSGPGSAGSADADGERLLLTRFIVEDITPTMYGHSATAVHPRPTLPHPILLPTTPTATSPIRRTQMTPLQGIALLVDSARSAPVPFHSHRPRPSSTLELSTTLLFSPTPVPQGRTGQALVHLCQAGAAAQGHAAMHAR